MKATEGQINIIRGIARVSRWNEEQTEERVRRIIGCGVEELTRAKANIVIGDLKEMSRGEIPATVRQKNCIMSIANTLGLNWDQTRERVKRIAGCEFRDLTKAEASRVIEEFRALYSLYG